MQLSPQQLSRPFFFKGLHRTLSLPMQPLTSIIMPSYLLVMYLFRSAFVFQTLCQLPCKANPCSNYSITSSVICQPYYFSTSIVFYFISLLLSQFILFYFILVYSLSYLIRVLFLYQLVRKANPCSNYSITSSDIPITTQTVHPIFPYVVCLLIPYNPLRLSTLCSPMFKLINPQTWGYSN